MTSRFTGLALAALCLSGLGCASEASRPDADMQADRPAGQAGAAPESGSEEDTLPAGKVHDGPAVVVIPLSQASESEETNATTVQVLEPDWDGCSPRQEEECSGNQAPVFGSPIFVVDGVQYEDLSEIRNGQELTIAMPVEDGECNLACGEFRSGVTSGLFAGSLPSNVPCSTAQSGVHLGLWLPIPIIRGPGLEGRVDHYEYSLTVLDRCGLASARFEGALDVRFENEPVPEPMQK